MPDTNVKALLLQVDASVELLKRNLQLGDAAVAQFQTHTTSKLAAMELSFDKLGAVAEGTAKKFELLRGGLEAIGLVLPALAFGEMVKQGIEFAASIGEQAKQAGVTAEKLQELRYAATQTGVSQEALQTTLIRLGQNLGKAELGSTKLQKAFQAIGISQADMKSHTATVDEAFSKLSDKMNQLGNNATAAGLASSLIGRSWAEAAPLLKAGSEKINELSKAAHDLGIVLSEKQIQNAEETAHKLKELELVLSANISKVVTDNAASIMTLVNALAKLVDMTGRAITGLKLFRLENMQKEQVDYANNGEPWGNMRDMLPTAWGGRRPVTDESTKRHLNQAAALGVQIDRLRNGGSSWVGFTPSSHVTLPGSDLPDFLGGKGHTPHDHSAEIARDNENKQYEIDKRTLDEKKQLLEAQQKITTDTEQRRVIELDILQVDHDLKAREIEHQLKQTLLDKNATDATKEAAKAQAAKAQILNNQLLVLHQEAAFLQQTLEDDREREDNRQATLKSEIDTLQLREQLAQTAKERRDVELEILQLQYQERREYLERIVNGRQPNGDPLYSPGDITRAKIELNGIEGDPNSLSLSQRQAAEQGRIMVSNAGPMDQFLRSIPDTAAKATEALQNVEVQGLQSISQGIIDVITGTKSLGQAFHDIANQIISDLLRIAIEKEIIGPLANSLFGAGGGGGGDLSALIADIPAFAGGGDPAVGMPSLVGERGPELFIPKVPGTIVPNHALGGGPQVIYVAVDKSALFDVHVQSQAAQVVAAAAPSIVAGAHGATMKALARQGING